MFKVKGYFFAIFAIALFLQGCNDDIFVEPAPDLVDNIKLSGYGDAAEFKLPMDGLKSVSFDNETDYYTSTDYYDANGEPANSLANVKKIVYGSPRFRIEVDIDGEDVRVRSIANTYDANLIMWAVLDYGYITRTVDIVITPGAPMEITECSYFMDYGVRGSKKNLLLRQRVTNNSDRTQRAVYYPYKDVCSRINVVADDRVFDGVKATVPVPLYAGGEWHESEDNTAEIEVGGTSYFYFAGVDINEEAYVDVPANTTVTIELTVEWATFEVESWIEFRLPNTDSEWIMVNPCKIFQSAGYELDVICEE